MAAKTPMFAAPADRAMSVGADVGIVGLRINPDLNDTRGTVISDLGGGRWAVQLANPGVFAGGAGTRTVSVKEVNLTLPVAPASFVPPVPSAVPGDSVLLEFPAPFRETAGVCWAGPRAGVPATPPFGRRLTTAEQGAVDGTIGDVEAIEGSAVCVCMLGPPARLFVEPEHARVGIVDGRPPYFIEADMAEIFRQVQHPSTTTTQEDDGSLTFHFPTPP